MNRIDAATDPATDPAADVTSAPADALGAPSNSTVVQVDQVLANVQDTSTHTLAGSAWLPQTDLGGNSSQPLLRPERSRALVSDYYPTAAGRFLSPAAERVLGFRHVKAGQGRSLWQLGDVSAAASANLRRAGDTTTPTPAAGSTYVLRGTWTSAGQLRASDGDWASQATMDATVGTTDTRSMWTTEKTDGEFLRFVSLYDGTCLDALDGSTTSGSPVGTYPCQDGAANQEWAVDGAGRVSNRQTGLLLRGGTSGGLEQAATGSDRASFGFAKVDEPLGVLPTLAFGNDTVAADTPSDLAVGDLDRAVDVKQASYADEAVIAWTDDDHAVQLRVVDYRQTPGTVTVTAPSASLGTAGGPDATVPGGYRPGSLDVAVGDFDGDAQNEIAVVWQNSAGAFQVSFLSYGGDPGQPQLTVKKPAQPLMGLLADAPTPLRVAGLADLVVGDFDGTGRESLALGWGGSSAAVLPAAPSPLLSVARFDASLTAVAETWVPLSTGNVLVPGKDRNRSAAAVSGPVSTILGIRLAAGYFDSRETNLHRRQIASEVRVQAAAFWKLGGTTALSRQVAVHTVGIADPAKPNALSFSTFAAPLQLGDGADVSRPTSIAAGGFSGDGGDKAPVWGLAVTQATGGDSYVQYVSVTHDEQGGHLGRPWRSSSGNTNLQYLLTSYDRAGDSLLLGAPLVATVTKMPRPQVVAAAPPSHADWIDGRWVNVSRNGELTVTMGTGTGTDYASTTKHSAGHTTGLGEKADYSAKLQIGVPEEKASYEVKLGTQLDQEWESEKATTEKYTSHDDLEDELTTADDDLIVGEMATTYLYQYPVLNQKVRDANGDVYTDGPCQPDGCYGYYTVAYPGPEMRGTVAGRNAQSYYEPTWENGNILSYPELGHAVPDGDLGTVMVGAKNAQNPLINRVYDLGGLTGSTSLKFNELTGTEVEARSSSTLKESASIDYSWKTTTGLIFGKVEQQGDVGVDFSDGKTVSDMSIGENTTTTSSSFKLEVPQIQADHSYQIQTVYYYDRSGAQKVAHAVGGLTDKSYQSYEWWQSLYGKLPDPALNLPNAKVEVKNSRGAFDDLRWNSSPARQKIRGFRVLQKDGQDAQNPADGASVQFQVPVHNYSLLAAGPTTVDFYAEPVDENDLEVDPGRIQHIGSQQVKAISARGMVTVTSPPWTGHSDSAADQQYRIFVVLNRTGDFDVKEIHPLNGTPCPGTETTQGTDPLENPMTGQTETLGCGQNNQGYGLVTVSATPALRAAAPGPAPAPAPGSTVDLAGSTLLDADEAPRAGADQAEVDHAVVGQQLTGLIRATSSRTSSQHQPVFVYDGDPADGNLIATTRLAGVDPVDGNTATFNWTPTRPGVHVLHQVLLGRTPGEGKSTQTLTVTVLPHGPAHHLAVRPAAAKATVGNPARFQVVAVDVDGNDVADVSSTAALTITPEGRCHAGSCTPARPGLHIVTATYRRLTGSLPLTVERARASRLAIVSGDHQVAARRAEFTAPLTVSLLDQGNNPMSGQKVTFDVAEGAASFGRRRTATTTTTFKGRATSPALVAGSRTGPVAVRARAGRTTVVSGQLVARQPRARTDLSTQMSLPERADRHARLSATVTIRNRGGHRISGAAIAVTVPNQLTVQGSALRHQTGNVVLLPVPQLKAHASRRITLRLRADKAGAATLIAVVIPPGHDRDRRDDTATRVVQVFN